jgi:hypothetical protein
MIPASNFIIELPNRNALDRRLGQMPQQDCGSGSEVRAFGGTGEESMDDIELDLHAKQNRTLDALPEITPSTLGESLS